MESLEDSLEKAFDDFKISLDNQRSLLTHLDLLKGKDLATYEHSVRVGLLASRIAEYLHLDPKALLFPGLLHDIGKVMISPETLKKTEGFGAKDMQEMRGHPVYSYRILRGVHEFSAEVALRHHRYQEHGYPHDVPAPRLRFSEGTKVMIGYYARILALVDFYDAATSRVNDKFGERRKLTGDEVKALMLERNPDQRGLIERLYQEKLFGDQP